MKILRFAEKIWGRAHHYPWHWWRPKNSKKLLEKHHSIQTSWIDQCFAHLCRNTQRILGWCKRMLLHACFGSDSKLLPFPSFSCGISARHGTSRPPIVPPRAIVRSSCFQCLGTGRNQRVIGINWSVNAYIWKVVKVISKLSYRLECRFQHPKPLQPPSSLKFYEAAACCPLHDRHSSRRRRFQTCPSPAVWRGLSSPGISLVGL